MSLEEMKKKLAEGLEAEERDVPPRGVGGTGLSEYIVRRYLTAAVLQGPLDESLRLGRVGRTPRVYRVARERSGGFPGERNAAFVGGIAKAGG